MSNSVKAEASDCTAMDCAKNALSWMWQLWAKARTDTEAQKLLRSLSIEAVEMAKARSAHNERFQKFAAGFLEGAHGKQPQTSSSFCDSWLTCGVFVRELESTGKIPRRANLDSPAALARAAIHSLKETFGKNWEESFEVSREFNIKGRKYSTPIGNFEWVKIPRAYQRDIVRKALRSAARTWRRQVG